jgi:hypothetical protein
LIKPRLFLPGTLRDDLESVISRISQITGMLRRQQCDIELVSRVCNLVDEMIGMNPVLRDRVKMYDIMEVLPSFLGGLDHPCQYDPSWTLDHPIKDLDFIVRLLDLDDEDFIEVKYSWAFDQEGSSSAVSQIREMMKLVFTTFRSLEVGDVSHGIEGSLVYEEDDLTTIDVADYIKRQRELTAIKTSLGLATLDELISSVVSSMRFHNLLLRDTQTDVNPLIRLRNRHEFLVSKARDLPVPDRVFEIEDLGRIKKRFSSSFRGRVTLKSDFLFNLGLENLPSLSVPISLS